MFPILLDRIDITGVVITADAMHPGRFAGLVAGSAGCRVHPRRR